MTKVAKINRSCGSRMAAKSSRVWLLTMTAATKVQATVSIRSRHFFAAAGSLTAPHLAMAMNASAIRRRWAAMERAPYAGAPRGLNAVGLKSRHVRSMSAASSVTSMASHIIWPCSACRPTGGGKHPATIHLTRTELELQPVSQPPADR